MFEAGADPKLGQEQPRGRDQILSKAPGSIHLKASALGPLESLVDSRKPSLSASVGKVLRWIQMALSTRQSLIWMEEIEFYLPRPIQKLFKQDSSAAAYLPTCLLAAAPGSGATSAHVTIQAASC